ncbi:MAG TPA: BadF/BadG/BcrA/BcrD ATPase family protein [Gemmataceae bacterium]|nr:BadF/BadG/BcrA/BcrD ATPase family protein [Gemmataceae bacterium]
MFDREESHSSCGSHSHDHHDHSHSGGGCSSHSHGKSSGGCGSHGKSESSGGGCCSTKSEPADAKLLEINLGALSKSAPARPPIHAYAFKPTEKYPQGLMIGLDVGSTTVKAVVVNPLTDEILWKDYQRHDTKQPEKCLEFLKNIQASFPDVETATFRIFTTGSGGSGIGRHLCAKFVQEVNAVSLAVEKLYPDVQSVVELGGQDAKIIIFKEDEETGKKKKIPSMNDKCAGGTGAVLDKINAKLKIPADQLCKMSYNGLKLHPVAGKCGVFAETDINGLQKQGVPPDELMASLFESIIVQNLSVLTRGHTLKPKVLLLGGPNCYIQGMLECWRHNIPLIWAERKVPLPPGVPVEELIIVPDNAQYFAALGAIEFAKTEVQGDPTIGVYPGYDRLEWYINVGRGEEKKEKGSTGLWKSKEELDAFKERYKKHHWEAPKFTPGTHVKAFLGLDGGSTSTKGVLLDMDKNLIAKAYQLSKGNPIEDMMDIVKQIDEHIRGMGCTLEICGVGTTGYAKDILKDVIGADVALVETVAHTQAGLHYYPGADVIVDVGGQDIKLIILKNGSVKDFKLNTQCSAGNGYFLQSTAVGFGFKVEDFADVAFSAKGMPEFGYGCAVFMQSDIVDFQRQGWAPEEIMAGLANVLPKNIWLYVSQIPNLVKLGTKFVLQGGTQHNLAAVKSQVDFIESRFRGASVKPEVHVHKFCGEAGAIGCAVEAHRLYTTQGVRTKFIGVEKIAQIQYRTTRDESTRCYFCKNKCLRTFLDVKVTPAEEKKSLLGLPVLAVAAPESKPINPKSKVPMMEGEQRLIIATCEKGTVEDVADMRDIKKGLDAIKAVNPNFVEMAAHEVFKMPDVPNVADPLPKVTVWNLLKHKELKARIAKMENRSKVRIGIVRALNMYSTAPFFLAYFKSLGLDPKNLIFSDYTSEEMYKQGANRGSIDPCFPSKVGIPHVHNLMVKKHTPEKPLNFVFFPMIDSLPSFLENLQAQRACPTVTATPEAVGAAFIKESNLFKDRGMAYKKTYVQLDDKAAAVRQMYADWGADLGLSEEENERAVNEGFKAMTACHEHIRAKASEALDRIEREDRLGVVVLARPYHNDPGLNHEITEELQKLGYPIFSQDHLPLDAARLERLFGAEVRRGDFKSPLSIDDAWKNSYSENTNRKVWAAKYAARHPHLVALELSSFKCGMDAPIYSVIEEIVENSGTPYFCFKDIDENKPTGSIKIRIETIDYFLKRYLEDKKNKDKKRKDIEEKLAGLERQMRQPKAVGAPHEAVAMASI